MTYDTDALAVWINGFFALAAASALLAIASVVMLIVSTRTARRPVPRSASRLPVLAHAYPGSTTTDQAA